MSPNAAPLTGQPDPSVTTPQPKQGFWGVLKNRVLPQVAPAMNRLAMSFGTPQEAGAAQSNIAQDQWQKEFQRQQQFDAPALQEARDRAVLSHAQLPDLINEVHSRAQAAAKTAAMTPGTLGELQKQKEIEATAGISGLMNLAGGNQPQSGQTPPSQVPTGQEPMSPLLHSDTAPAPIAQAAPSGPSSTGIPAPQEILQAQIARTMGTPITDKEQTQNPDGSWSYKRRNPYTGILVGEEPAAGPPTRMMPTKSLVAYLPPGVSPDKATQEDWAVAANAANTRTSSSTSPSIQKDAMGNIVSIPVTRSTTASRGTAPATPGVAPANQSKTVPTPSASTPKPRAGTGAATQVMGPGGVPLHQPISSAGKNTLYQIDSTMNLIGDPKNPQSLFGQLEARKSNGTLWDAAKQRAAWEEYSKLGIVPSNIDPQMAKLLPLIAQTQILGGMPYLRGIRNQRYIQQIQQHVPDPTKDTPELMVSKLENLTQTLPLLKQAVYESEGVGTPSVANPMAVSAAGGASGAQTTAPKTASDYLNKFKK